MASQILMIPGSEEELALKDANKQEVALKDANKVLTKWNDLKQAGVTKNDIFKQYEKVYGVRPQNVHLNEGICNDYHHHCYNVQGKVLFTKKSSQLCTTVSTQQQFINNSDDLVTQEHTLEGKFTRSATVSVTHSSSFSFGEDISIHSDALGIGTDFSYEFKVKNSIGSESSTSNTITVSDTETVPLPPGHSMNLKLVVEWTKETQEFEIPITISGLTGANFHHKVQGHYYWFLLAPDGLKSSIRGKVDCAYDVKTSIIAENLH